MKTLKFYIILSAVLLFSLLGRAQNGSGVSNDAKSAKITWISMEHDFGEITQGIPVTATFEFKNVFNEPIVISNVRTSCGCTVAEYSKKPILPGESSTISVTYNAQKAGVFNKIVSVTMDEKDEYKLTVKGSVINKK
jgi:hypothetical protein